MSVKYIYRYIYSFISPLYTSFAIGLFGIGNIPNVSEATCLLLTQSYV